MKDFRTAWIATCVFWAWTWAISAFGLAPFTFGLSLLMLIPAGLSAWAVMLPVGKPQPGVPYVPPLGYHGPSQVLPPNPWR